MKVKYFFLLVFLWPFFCNAQYMWQALPSAPASYRFDDFHFINPDTGWAINPYYVHSRPNQFGRVFRTIDGGANWTQLVDSSITYYRSIGFADGQNGWIGNLADTVPYAGVPSTTDTIPLYQTNDGGTSWTPVNLPHPHPAGICGISVVTDSVVYAYGRYFGPAGFVKTIDKGNSWVFYDLDTIALGLIDGHFFNKDTGFITGMSPDHKAIILGTVNGGTSWTFAYYSSRADSDRVWKIYFPSRNIGYASVQHESSYYIPFNTWFLKTTDGGKTWIENHFFANYNEEGIGFINDNVGWIGGDERIGTFKTTDGGDTWYNDESFGVPTPPYTSGTSGFSMNRFRSFGDTVMYASGNTIYKLKRDATGVRELSIGNESIGNYPNPFKEQTTITYYLPEAADNLILRVINMLGQQVYTKALGSCLKGNNQFLFNEGFPGGVYYYTISNDKFRVTRKMMVIK